MKHFLILVFLSFVSAQPPLGSECTVSADCGRQVDNKICVHGKCVLMEPKQHTFYGIVGVQSGLGSSSNSRRSMPQPCDFGWPCDPIHRDFKPNGMKCGNTYCTTGFGCINGRCKFNGNKFEHFLHTPCPVPCEEFGKVCVRGVCK